MKATILTNKDILKNYKIVYNFLYYFISALLIFSGIVKLINPQPTIETLKVIFHISEKMIYFIKILLPVIEITLALMMIYNLKRIVILYLIISLFSSFTFLSIYGTIIGIQTDCGCFSNIVKSEFGVTMILRNLIITAITIWLLIENKKFARA